MLISVKCMRKLRKKAMLIEFSVKNYRSFRDEHTLSLAANPSKIKKDNMFEYNNLKLLKYLVIYGPNASGKSNIIRAFFTFNLMVKNSIDLKIGEEFDKNYYDPFLFDKDSPVKATDFKIEFIGRDTIRYRYEISYSKKKILYEELDFYPGGHKNNLFIRKAGEEIKLGKSFKNKRVDKKLLDTHLFLTKIGNSGHEQMGKILLNFSDFEIWNVLDQFRILKLTRHIENIFADKNNYSLKKRLNKLINIADTGIESITVDERLFDDSIFPPDTPEEIKSKIIKQNKYKIFANHKVYSNKKEIDKESLDFENESAGTKILFALGGLILEKLERGGVIFFDELDNSLHPKLCRFLIRLFQHPKTNPNNAQLIFSTHDTSLLDKGLFRKDQILFTEKNKYGGTELFSADDFDGVRDNIPFGDWYMKGKFGAQPNIKEMEFIFSDEEADDEQDNFI